MEGRPQVMGAASVGQIVFSDLSPPLFKRMDANMPVVSLPFVCAADITPKGKRKPRRHDVRCYTDVLIPEYSASELPVAITVKQGVRSHGFRSPERVTKFLSHRKELLLRALDMDCKPLSVERFTAIVGPEWREPYSPYASERPGFDALPRPGKRHDGHVPHPLMTDSLENICDRNHWVDPAVDYIDLARRMGDAQAFYSRAVALVDGRLHLQAQEPVWLTYRSERYDPTLLRHNRPALSDTYKFFRLDALERALDFVGYPQAKRAEIFGGTGVQIVMPEEITRIDAFELSQEAFCLRDELVQSIRVGLEYAEDHPLPRLAERNSEPPAFQETAAVLEEMERGWAYLTARSTEKRMAERFPALKRLVDRIVFELRSGSYIPSHDLCEEDLDALVGI